MKMNWYFFKGGLNKRTVQAILLICVGTAVASAQVYWFFYFCFSLLWVLAFYVTDRVGICITDVNEMLLMSINSEHDKKEKALYMTTFAINNEYFLDDYYAKEKNIKK